jgi:hypothetical protein
MATRIAIQRELSRLLYADSHDPITGTNSSSTGTTITETTGNLKYSSGDVNAFDRKYVYVVQAADAGSRGESRVTEGGWTVTGSLTVDPSISSLASGDLFIISDHPPIVLQQSINRVIRNMYENTLWPLSLHVTKNDSNDMEPSSIATDFKLSDGNAAAATESTRVYHGAQSLKLTADNADEYAALTTQMAVTENEQLVAGILSSVTQGDDFIYRVIDVTNAATIDSATNDEVRWAELIIPFGVPGGCEEIDLRMIEVGSNDVCYCDNIQVWSQSWGVYPLPSWVTRPEQVVDVRYWPQGTAAEGNNAYIPDETRSRPLSWRFESGDRRAGSGTRLSPVFLGVATPGYNRPFVVLKRGLSELSTDIATTPAEQDQVVHWAERLIREPDNASETMALLRAIHFQGVTTELPTRIGVSMR